MIWKTSHSVLMQITYVLSIQKMVLYQVMVYVLVQENMSQLRFPRETEQIGDMYVGRWASWMPCQCRRYACLVPGLGRSLGEGTSIPLQYSCLENTWTEKSGGLQSLRSQESDMIERLNNTTNIGRQRQIYYKILAHANWNLRNPKIQSW